MIYILQTYQQEIESGRVLVIPDFAVPFLAGVAPGSLDWIYLDASHSYDATLAELRVAIQAVKPGGYIIGDDYDPDPESKQHGVYRAVNQLLEETRQGLLLDKSRQWAFRV